MHGQVSQVFMGYGSVESLLADQDPKWTQLYLFFGIESQPTKYGNFSIRTYYATISRIEGQIVHYCRVEYGRAQVVTDHTGAPVGDCERELQRIRKRGESLETVLTTYLSKRCFAMPRNAAPTFPQDVRPIIGTQGFARFDSESNAYVGSEVA